MANTNQRALRAQIKRWANGSHKPMSLNPEGKMQYEKSPKAAGKDRPGHGKRTNVGDPRKAS
jgi:hypothetical protein